MPIPVLEPDDTTFELVWMLYYLIITVFIALLTDRVLERRYGPPGTVAGWTAVVCIPLIPALILSTGAFGRSYHDILDGGALVSVNMMLIPLTVAVSTLSLYRGDRHSILTVSMIDCIAVIVGSGMVSLGIQELIDSYFAGNTYVELIMCEVAFGVITALLMGNRMDGELRRFAGGSKGYAGPYMVATIITAVSITGCLLLWLYNQGTGDPLMSTICIASAVSFVVMVRVMFIGISDVTSHARRDAEIDTASRLQQSIIPDGRNLDWMRGITVRSVMEPAREIAGDFCDFFPITDRRVGLVVADVSGKGIPAALFMMRCKSVIRDMMTSGRGLEDAVSAADSALSEDNPTCMFVTAFLGVLDLDSGELEYINAGHVPPFVRMSGDIGRLDGGRGPMMGIMEHRYASSRVILSDGDVVLAYTDGVNEAEHDGSFYGEGRIPGIVSSEDDAGTIVDSLRSDVRTFIQGSEPTDDMTILCLTYRGTVSEVFPAERDRCGDAVQWVSGHSDPDISLRMELITEETFLNIADNAYPGTTGDVRITVEQSDGNFSITFTDSGVMFDPTSAGYRNEGIPVEDRGPGGEGIRLISAMADTMSYSRTGDRNILTITLSKEKKGDHRDGRGHSEHRVR